ncbi:MAG: response regulator [Clostridia bacterium]|nr:response regulator [Clostridia bacterium]
MKQILLLDDDLPYLTEFTKVIEKTTGYAVVPFRTSEEAIAAIERAEHPFSAFILDIEMTGQKKSGIDVAQHIRQLPENLLKPLIFLTSHTHYSFGALRHLHYYDFFNKGCSVDTICNSLKKALMLSEPDSDETPKIVVQGIRYAIELSAEDLSCIELFGSDLVVTDLLGNEQRIRVKPHSFADICRQLSAVPTLQQIHRCVIINMHKIKKIEWFKNTASVWLFNISTSKPVGKTHLPKLDIYKK